MLFEDVNLTFRYHTGAAIGLLIIKRSVLPTCKHILTMAFAERKALGTSKSGLWYQTKKLAEDNTIKVHGKVLSKIGKDSMQKYLSFRLRSSS